MMYLNTKERYEFKLAEELFENNIGMSVFYGKRERQCGTHSYDKTCPNETYNCSNRIQDYTHKTIS